MIFLILALTLCFNHILLSQDAPEVARSVFTTDVQDREPVNDLDSVYTDLNKVFYFSELRNLQGRRIVHRWLHEDKMMAEIPFEVHGSRWRIFSSKNLAKDWLGKWTVEVVDQDSSILHQDGFVFLREDMTRAGAASEDDLQVKTEAKAEEKTPEKPDRTGGGEAVSGGVVRRGLFTTDVIDREPADSVDSLATDVNKVFFFTECVDMSGQTLTHRWIYDGQVMAEVSFEIGGRRWRVHSSKNLVPSWTGTWKVEILVDGAMTDERSFTYFNE